MARPCRPATRMGVNYAFRSLFPPRITVRASQTASIGPFPSSLTNYDNRRHLLFTGRREEAARVVATLNGVPADDPLVDELVGELEFSIAAENDHGKATWAECFSPSLWRRTVNGMMLQFIQQLNGQNFYCTCLSYLPSSFLRLRLGLRRGISLMCI
jgi:hypothetical protein